MLQFHIATVFRSTVARREFDGPYSKDHKS